MRENADFSTTVCGIPCGVVVDSYSYQAPSRKPASMCSCPDEYYGSEDIEWHLVDRKGYKANWLEAKMSENDIEQIEIEISERWRR